MIEFKLQIFILITFNKKFLTNNFQVRLKLPKPPLHDAPDIVIVIYNYISNFMLSLYNIMYYAI